MSMSDPIGDMLARIRNAQMVGHPTLRVRRSRIKVAILEVMRDEGYITGFSEPGDGGRDLEVELKYYAGAPVIESIRRVSRPGLRQYRGAGEIGRVRNGFGIAILSTSQGVMTDFRARELGVGGEVICHVS